MAKHFWHNPQLYRGYQITIADGGYKIIHETKDAGPNVVYISFLHALEQIDMLIDQETKR